MQQPEPSVRLFIAAPAPVEWHEWLSSAQRSLEQALPGYFRWVSPEHWHITVIFLGSQPATTVPRIGETLQAVCHATPLVSLSAGEVGGPGSPRRPRLAWLRCDDGGVLSSAHQALKAKLEDLGIDTVPFRAHITLGRARRPAPVPFAEALIALNHRPRPEPTQLRELVLFRSHLDARGARYEELARAALGSPVRGCFTRK